MLDLTPILQALIGLLSAAITTVLIPWIVSKWGVERRALVQSTLMDMVRAAEQILGSGKGAEKLMAVEGWMTQKGMRVDRQQIEAAVQQLTASLAAKNVPATPVVTTAKTAKGKAK